MNEIRIKELMFERDKLTAHLGALRETSAVMEKHNYGLFKSLEEAENRLEESKTRQYGEREVHQGANA